MSDIRHLIPISAAPDKIQQLVGTGPGFAKWWAEDMNELAGGEVELGFFNRATVWRFRLVRPPTPLEIEWLCVSGTEWKDTRLRFKLAQEKNDTTLRFTQANWAAETEFFTRCNTTWGGLMFRLKAAAEGKNPGPHFTKSGAAY